MIYLVYPGATHTRFEHCLGVMEIVGQLFDGIAEPDALERFTEADHVKVDDLDRWRRSLRFAALCHDIGHLPFSHAVEEELLPIRWKSHEAVTADIIKSEEVTKILESADVDSEVVMKLAVGEEDILKMGRDTQFSRWESVLSDLITHKVFGADRMDYLLRDSYYTGVPQGLFDYKRLIRTIRILPQALEVGDEVSLGVDIGGLHSAESLIISRYFMFSQVYFNKTRRICDIHLGDFLKQYLPGGNFPDEIEEFLTYTDDEINAAIASAVRDVKCEQYQNARRICRRDHFRVLYEFSGDDLGKREEFYLLAIDRYGEDSVRKDYFIKPEGGIEFPVRGRNGESASSVALSQILGKIPSVPHSPPLTTSLRVISDPVSLQHPSVPCPEAGPRSAPVPLCTAQAHR
jgi:HD superfamily phosphohydrolase